MIQTRTAAGTGAPPAPARPAPRAPSLRETLRRDLAANSYRRGALGMVSALLFSPSFVTVARHRVVFRLYAGNAFARFIGRLIWHGGVRASACHIHPRARIGPGLALPHPTAIVVGEGVVIGGGVTIYQGVTLGTDRMGGEGYPEVGDGVILYAGATLLGALTVGDHAVVGAHVLTGESVPAGARLTRKGLRPVG